MDEVWRSVAGYEGRYEVSNLGRVKSTAFMQRFVSKGGKECFRRTRERILAQHPQNSGYLLVWLWLNNAQSAKTVHRLVAEAFLPPSDKRTVNHIDGDKTNNAACNLEWATHAEQHRHAVFAGLSSQAIPVVDPSTGAAYPSVAEAARACRKAHRTVRRDFCAVQNG